MQGIKINDDGTINFGYVPDPSYEVATGISKINAGKANKDSEAYNLSGQRVGSGYHGIVIKDGKKFYQK